LVAPVALCRLFHLPDLVQAAFVLLRRVVLDAHPYDAAWYPRLCGQDFYTPAVGDASWPHAVQLNNLVPRWQPIRQALRLVSFPPQPVTRFA
jgi:hypothetical protein